MVKHLFWFDLSVAIAGVFACLTLIFFSINRIFPEADFMKIWFQEEVPSVSQGLTQTGLQADRRTLAVPNEKIPSALRLAFIQNEVKSRGSEERAWSRAYEGGELHHMDAVQTMGGSHALLVVNGENYLNIQENSFVMLKQEDVSKNQGWTAELSYGSLRVQMGESGLKNADIEVATPTALASVDSSSGSRQPADFQVRVGLDKTSSVAVYKGVVRVKAQGASVMVKENQMTLVGIADVPAVPRSLHAPVLLRSPEGGGVFFYRDLPVKVSFTWSPSLQGMSYHAQIARDETFRDLVSDAVVSVPAFSYMDFKQGTYWWRISALDKDGTEGPWSVARKIEIVRSVAPSVLRLHAPKGDLVVTEERISIEGVSDPRSKVYVNGRAVVMDATGYFKKEVLLGLGDNEIVVEAVDLEGNATLQKRVVMRKPEEKMTPLPKEKERPGTRGQRGSPRLKGILKSK